MVSGIDDLSARGVLLAAEDARRREMVAQSDMLALAAHWCDLHGAMDYDEEARVAPVTRSWSELVAPARPTSRSSRRPSSAR
jgi:hypothetical protein